MKWKTPGNHWLVARYTSDNEMVRAIQGESERRQASMTRTAIIAPIATSTGSTGDAPSQRWLSRSASQIRYALASHESAAHSQSSALGRVTGDRFAKGKARKTSGTRKSRCIDRCTRGSNTPYPAV